MKVNLANISPRKCLSLGVESGEKGAEMKGMIGIVILKILQARLQQYMNCELPDVQAGFRKGRGTRDQIANIC